MEEAQSFIFGSAEDALQVAELLPQAKVIDTQVVCQDKRALELATSLVNVSDWVQFGTYCQLPYPEHEREYDGNSPRIYVRCLSAYNNGLLHGLWIDATQDEDDIWDDINWMLSWSPVAHREACEEWAIHDYEGFGSFRLSEYEDLETVSKVASAIEEHGKAFTEYISYQFPYPLDIDDWDEVVEQFQFAFVGHFESEEDFVLTGEEIDEIYGFKVLQEQFPFWANHISWESVATDLFCCDYYSTKATGESYGIYVFRNC